VCPAAQRDDRGPPHRVRELPQAHGQRAASAQRVSRRLGLDRASHVRLHHSRFPPGNGPLLPQAFLRVPGRKIFLFNFYKLICMHEIVFMCIPNNKKTLQERGQLNFLFFPSNTYLIPFLLVFPALKTVSFGLQQSYNNFIILKWKTSILDLIAFYLRALYWVSLLRSRILISFDRDNGGSFKIVSSYCQKANFYQTILLA